MVAISRVVSEPPATTPPGENPLTNTNPERVAARKLRRADAIVGDKRLRFRKLGRNARRGNWFFTVDPCRDIEIQIQELFEQIFLGRKAVSFEDGRIERGVSILERVLAGEFEGAIDGFIGFISASQFFRFAGKTSGYGPKNRSPLK
jgi:hypothetical protein